MQSTETVRVSRIWEWTCKECGATGIMPETIYATPHNCRRHLGPYATIARIFVQEADGRVE